MAKPIKLDGIIKHANVARILYRNRVRTDHFYIAARVCQEHIDPATIASIAIELKTDYINASRMVWELKKKGFLTTTKTPQGTRVDPTLEGWTFYMLLLAEMERPIRDLTAFDDPRKCRFKPRVKTGPKAGDAMKRRNIAALARRRGLSIWERCGLASLPLYQRLKTGAPKLSAQANSPATSKDTSPA